MEKRQHERKRTLLRATALFSNGQFAIPCLVRDISFGGMKLAISDAISIPERFDLHMLARNEVHYVALKWRSASNAGVALLSAAGPIPVPTIPDSGTVSADLEVEISRLNGIVRRLVEERDALRKMLMRKPYNVAAASRAIGADARKMDVHRAPPFDVFDDVALDWKTTDAS